MRTHPRPVTAWHTIHASATRFSVARRLGVAATAALLMSCSDPATAPSPTGSQMSICHVAGAAGGLMDIRASQLAEHLGHGDYVALLVVEKGSATSRDSGRFSRIGDALASARATRLARAELSTSSCRITIAVGPGLYQGSVQPSADPAFERLPLVIDVPDVTLLGTFIMPIDEKRRATGTESYHNASNTTTLAASPGLLSGGVGAAINESAEQMIIVNAHPDGSRGDGTVIEGFIFQSGNAAAGAIVGGNAVLAVRAERLEVRGNQFEGGFAEPVDMREARARIERNYLMGRAGSCGLCLFGPGDYQVVGNRQIGPGGIPGILIFPAQLGNLPVDVEPNVLPASALVTVTVMNNDVRNYQAIPVGVGVRIGAIGVGASGVTGTSRVLVRDNDLSDNRFAVIVEAGFPVANTALRGDVELTLIDNTLAGSCQNSVLVALNMHTSGLGLTSGPTLLNSTFTLTMGDDIPWDNVWYSHPAGTGNTLIVNGATIENGEHTAYDAARICPAP